VAKGSTAHQTKKAYPKFLNARLAESSKHLIRLVLRVVSINKKIKTSAISTLNILT